jgi:hypothetical protein
MKKLLSILAGVVVAGAIAFAGQVYDRADLDSDINGVVSWTNEVDYAAVKLARIWVLDAVVATDVVTIVRTTASGEYTQAVGSVTAAGSVGNTATFTAGYLLPGDILTATGANTTNYELQIEYEVQQH